jgi:Tol biopolymer transport system component
LVVDAATGDTKEAFSSREHFPFYLSWSPDGQYLTLLSNSRSAPSLSLHLVDSGGGADRILHTGQPFYWDWSPDAQRIMVHTGGSRAQNQDAALGLLDPVNQLSFSEFDLKPSAFQSPAWSPDGDGVILAVEVSGGKEKLVLAGEEGEILSTLAEIDGAVAFAWSPQGKHLAYSNRDKLDSRQGIKSLTLISPLTDEPAAQLLSGPLLAWFWSPDGQKIAYFMLVDSMGKGGNRVAQTQAQSRMGLFVFDLKQRKSQQVALFRPTDGLLEVIPFFDQYQRSSTFWSPDSRSLVIAAQDANNVEGIYIVAADGSQAPVKIAEGVIGFFSRQR